MQTSDSGIKELINSEGEELVAYKCSAGVWTIGFGTTQYPNGEKVKQGDKITKEQALKYLRHDLSKFETQVNRLVQVPLTQNQFDALVSFTYNVGGGGLQKSTTLKRLNAGDYKGAAKALLRWNKVRNEKTGKLEFSQGLYDRRKREMELFLNDYAGKSITGKELPIIQKYPPNPNNTPLRNNDLPLPTAYQQHGIDSVEEKKTSPAVVTAGAGGVIAGGVGISEVVQHAPAIFSFLQNADWRVALSALGLAAVIGSGLLIWRWWR